MTANLGELMQSYGSDKGPSGHNFTKFYTLFFAPIKDSVKRVLEIGVSEGYSLEAWRDYFINAEVHGIDSARISEHRGRDILNLNSDRIKIHIGDQMDREFLQNVADIHGPFDIIVDDGSHKSTDQLFSFYALFPYLKSGGYYVIEDIFDSYDGSKFSGLRPRSFVATMKDHIDIVNFYGATNVGDRHKAIPIVEKLIGQNFSEGSPDRNLESIFFSDNLVIVKKLGVTQDE